MNDFSYAAYSYLIKTLMQAIPLRDFSEIQETTSSFFILRHDVEFSVEKAYALACLEREKLGIQTSYFFQIRNYTYNPFSAQNAALIKAIHAMGHRIGLHVNMAGVAPQADITGFILKEVALFQQGLALPIDRFSFHRPTQVLLAAYLNIPGLINTYDARYFHFYQGSPPDALNVYYFSDSEHRWKYGDPRSILEKPLPKIQLLIHPYSWSEEGFDNIANFRALAREKYGAMLKGMSEECHHFPQELFHETL